MPTIQKIEVETTLPLGTEMTLRAEASILLKSEVNFSVIRVARSRRES